MSTTSTNSSGDELVELLSNYTRLRHSFVARSANIPVSPNVDLDDMFITKPVLSLCERLSTHNLTTAAQPSGDLTPDVIYMHFSLVCDWNFPAYSPIPREITAPQLVNILRSFNQKILEVPQREVKPSMLIKAFNMHVMLSPTNNLDEEALPAIKRFCSHVTKIEEPPLYAQYAFVLLFPYYYSLALHSDLISQVTANFSSLYPSVIHTAITKTFSPFGIGSFSIVQACHSYFSVSWLNRPGNYYSQVFDLPLFFNSISFSKFLKDYSLPYKIAAYCATSVSLMAIFALLFLATFPHHATVDLVPHSIVHHSSNVRRDMLHVYYDNFLECVEHNTLNFMNDRLSCDSLNTTLVDPSYRNCMFDHVRHSFVNYDLYHSYLNAKNFCVRTYNRVNAHHLACIANGEPISCRILKRDLSSLPNNPILLGPGNVDEFKKNASDIQPGTLSPIKLVDSDVPPLIKVVTVNYTVWYTSTVTPVATITLSGTPTALTQTLTVASPQLTKTTVSVTVTTNLPTTLTITVTDTVTTPIFSEVSNVIGSPIVTIPPAKLTVTNVLEAPLTVEGSFQYMTFTPIEIVLIVFMSTFTFIFLIVLSYFLCCRNCCSRNRTIPYDIKYD